jgi:hypothetical protein
MRTELDALKGERTGHVKVAAMDSFFEELLPATVEEFLPTSPRSPTPSRRRSRWRFLSW